MIEKNEMLEQQNTENVQIETKHRPFKVNVQTQGINLDGFLTQVTGIFRFKDIIQNITPETKFVVTIPDKFQEAYNSGDLLMTQSKDGTLWPSLYKKSKDGKHVLVCNLPAEEVSTIQGNPMNALSENIQSMIMQHQIAELKSAVQEITEIVKRIEQGQTNDRIGLLVSGRDQLYMALKNLNKIEQKQELLLARKDISNAQGQIFQTLGSRAFRYEIIPDKGVSLYLKRLNTKYASKREEDFEAVQNYCKLYVDATKLLATSYAVAGDMDRAVTAINLAAEQLRTIDFSRVASIENIHPGRNYFFNGAPDKLLLEGHELLDRIGKFDYLELEINGEKLLEVINGRKEGV